jgi:curli biogenesis system outer membrane secretion channel CsgG
MEVAMRKAVQFVALAVALATLAPLSGAAQAKIRIAIWEFDNNSERSFWFSDRLGPAARNQIDTAFSDNPTLTEKFTIVERSAMALIMKEQGLALSGALDPQSAAKVGKLLGVKYIVTGGIDKFAINRTSGAVGRLGIGGTLVQAEATINVRFIDTTTGERVVSVSADADIKKGGGFVRGTSLSRDAEWGLASEAVEKATKDLVDRLLAPATLARIGPGTGPASGLEGKIAKIDGQRAWLTIGASSGVKVGDKFAVFNVGDAVIDPDTGQSLGAEEKEIGTGAVTDVQERFAVITFTGTAKVRDVVRKRP